MKDRIRSIKLRRFLAVLFFSACLCALIAYNAMRPSQEDKDLNTLREAMSSGARDMPAEQRNEMRRIFEKLSPESKDKLAREFLREQLRIMREETASMSEEEKIQGVETAVKEFREQFSKIPESEKIKIKERINTPEAKEQFKMTMELYSTEFTAKERELLDPLVYEVMEAINSL